MPPIIDPDKCTGCSKCVFVCGRDVFTFAAELYKAKVFAAKNCFHCFLCSDLCPQHAIAIRIPKKRSEFC